ncbi:MAG: type II/IV secretion system ATPase subunit [Nitrososphaeria archaeon]
MRLSGLKLKRGRNAEERPFRFSATAPPVLITGKIIDEYSVGDAQVIITDAGEKHFYIIREPELSVQEKQLYSELMEAIYYSFKPGESDQISALENFIWKASEDLEIMEQVKLSYSKLRYYLLRDALGYGVADVLMKDDDVEEISCEGYGKPVAVVHRRYPGFDWLDTNLRFDTEEELARFVQKIVMKSGKTVSTAVPYVDATMPDGSRLAATFGSEISMPGSTFDIRKFPRDPFTAPKLIALGTLSPLLAAYYWLVLEAKGFAFIIGATGSGKTTTLNVFLQLINPNLKIATVEETPEISIPHEHWERLKTRYTFGGSASDIDIFDLTKLTLRIRPDYIIVGEARGAEIRFLFQASASGHGALSTFHGESVEGAIARMTSEPLNVGKAQLLLVWSFLQVNRVRLESGNVVRRATVSKEVDPMNGNLTEIFRWDPRADMIFPEEAERVAENSVRLRVLESLWGWDRQRLVEELEERAEFLKNIVNEKKFSLGELTPEVRKFYTKKYYSKG